MTKVYFAVDPDGSEFVFEHEPYRSDFKEFGENVWYCNSSYCEIPRGTIFKLTGKKLTWVDEFLIYDGEEL